MSLSLLVFFGAFVQRKEELGSLGPESEPKDLEGKNDEDYESDVDSEEDMRKSDDLVGCSPSSF